ncbi:DUF222 domain-containing protein [Arthrobacter sp. AQ5-05]|uniref:HNH endonuclease signature motif containing protein n=1 Tax=Arthrobacter sp. AQ5-05 TaxID=2184581 RepID=UPI0011BE7187|nr:DUF222 domain-containing protein [Arthrobacter sp. AQ5-05]
MGTSLSAPRTGQMGTAELGQQLAAAALALSAATGQLALVPLDAAAAAAMMGLVERSHRAIAYAQLLITRRADAAEVHRLDPVTAQHIDQLVAQPGPLADGTAGIPAGELRQGMAPHRNTQAYMQAHLHISTSEARRRINGSKLLVASPAAGSDEAPPAPSYPILAKAASDGSADVANLASMAGQLESMQPRIKTRPDAENVNTAIEGSLAHEARTGDPKTCGQALRDWGGFLAENGTPISDEEIRARRGLFYRGFRDGSDEYLLRCDPEDSEVLFSFCEAWTNPRSTKSPPFSASTTHRPPSGGFPTMPSVPTGPVDGQDPAGDPRPEAGQEQCPEELDPDTSDGTPSKVPANPDPDPATEAPPSAAAGEGTTGETRQPGTFYPSPSGTPTFSPAGTPAPEWATPAGASGSQIPLSEFACGLPPDGSGLEQLTSQDPRTSPQILLDALIAACAGAMNGTDIAASGGMRVKIGVLIGYRSLLGQCEEAGLTDHNRPISAANVRRLACNGDILPAVMGDEGAVLDLGRELRGFTRAQRRAIAIRDRGCIIPGCKHPASMSECHHVIPWSEGGPTSVENSAMLCEYHHLQVHAGLIKLRSINGVPYVVEIAGQPHGAPQRNLYWHPELRTAGYQAPLFEVAPGTRRC